MLWLSASFLAIGWTLSALIGWPQRVAIQPKVTLEALRERPEIVGLVTLVPMVNAVFLLLVLEATRQMQHLARYRFLLGVYLGGGQPIWRWERFKSSPEGSSRPTTLPANLLLGTYAFLMNLACFWFAWPGAQSGILRFGWWMSVALVAGASAAALTMAWDNRVKNPVADPPGGISYEGLGFVGKDSPFME